MSANILQLLLVTPVWNDSVRLEGFGMRLANALAEAGLRVTWVIADDGSDTGEKDELRRLHGKFREIYSDVHLDFHSKRSRKGGAIYQSWQNFPDADYYVFVDADGAIEPDTVITLMKSAVNGDDAWEESFVAVRDLSGPMEVRRSLLRKASFYLFRGMVRVLVGLKSKDTQCGAKVISSKAYRAVEAKLEERGYVFDVELLAVMGREGWPIYEIAIPWREVSGSKICLRKDIWSMLAGLMRIRKRLNVR